VISVIILASFAVPLTLYTGNLLVRGHVGTLFSLAHSMSIKEPVKGHQQLHQLEQSDISTLTQGC
jgi:hypothetical protein